jgi:hypothetical protein
VPPAYPCAFFSLAKAVLLEMPQLACLLRIHVVNGLKIPPEPEHEAGSVTSFRIRNRENAGAQDKFSFFASRPGAA